MTATNVGLVGLGRMGLAKAKHVIKAGYPVYGFDVSADALNVAVEAGVVPVASAAAVAEKSELVIVIVPSDDDVKQACTGDDGVLAGAKAVSIIALCSSLMPETVTVIAEAAPAGVDILDLPSARGPIAADEGNLALMAGGDADALERARPVLETFATAIHHVGPVGAGQITKTVNNILLWSNMQTSLEVLALARRLGLDPEAMREALYDCSADSWALRHLHALYPAWPVKDMNNALALAKQAGADMPVAELMGKLAESLTQARAEEVLFGKLPRP